MKTSTIFLLTTLLLSLNSYSQSYNRQSRSFDILANPDRSFNSRNQATTNQKTPQFQSQRKMLPLSDSTFLISGKVLINLKADAYKLIFGLSQEAVTSKGCNDTINARIEKFIKDLGKIGIGESEKPRPRAGEKLPKTFLGF